MPIAFEPWLAVMRREYFATFIPKGSGAVRFLVAADDAMPRVSRALTAAAIEGGLSVITIDTATTRLHMLHFAFFAIVKALDWDALCQARLEHLVTEAGYHWPEPGQRCKLIDLAHYNGVAPPLLRNTLQQLMTRLVWDDPRLAQGFRKAMIALLDAHLTGDPEASGGAVLAWLRGETTRLRGMRDAQIGARIGRHNARAMLMPLCHWLRCCGHRGVLVTLDLRRLLHERREVMDGIVYTAAAVMD